MEKTQLRKLYLVLLILESLFLVYMSLQSVVPTLPEFLFFRRGDLEHLAAYVIYGFLMERTLKSFGVKTYRYFYAIAFASAFAAGTELIQVFVPGRFPDVLDWAIDTIGVAFGAFVKKKFV